jgi:1-deoxy-D-xylulose-5-phosphate reductoisomerase
MSSKTAQRNIALLGATGSIGASALDVIGRHPDRYRVSALTAGRQWEALLELIERFRPPVAGMRDPEAAQRLEGALRGRGLPTRVFCGAEGLRDVATLPEVDTVIAAIVGAAGLESTLAAARAGKRILLANKETLVLAGEVFMSAVRDSGAILLPIDSEHNAIFQCLPQDRTPSTVACGVRRILLTASGGPFRVTPLAELESVSPEQACAHPKWRMGRKISVDSATMMNKGLEVIEAHWLFGVAADTIEVVIHPESVVHSLVEYLDGSVLAQLGNPDMRTPIAQALAWPERIDSGVAPLELARIGSLNFFAPDLGRFPCLGVAYEALSAGGTAPAILNAANEVAVEAFLQRKIGFLDIARACEATLRRVPATALSSLDDALDADREARAVARELFKLELPQQLPA